jgi:hypothetical protein
VDPVDLEQPRACLTARKPDSVDLEQRQAGETALMSQDRCRRPDRRLILMRFRPFVGSARLKITDYS